MTSARHHHRAPLRTRLVAVLALASLAWVSLSPLVDVEWAAWSYNHGHATASGLVMPHAHPWDDAARGLAAAGATNAIDAGESGEATDPIVFTANGDSVPGVTVLWTAPVVGIAIAMLTCLVALAALRRPVAFALVPPPPPPRGALSPV